MNHETQRLLSAAGRGARVQYWDLSKGRWLQKPFLVPCSVELSRIHPEDAHLQYGPVSAELRYMCAFCAGEAPDKDFLRGLAAHLSSLLNECGPWSSMQDEDLSWLCAFAAELAADEGM